MKYVECIYCRKKITLNSQAVIRKGYTGYYCSWECAGRQSGFFDVVCVDQSDIIENNISMSN